MVGAVLQTSQVHAKWLSAGVYSSVLTYPRAVKTVGTKEATDVMRQMEASRIHDVFAEDGNIRSDRKMVHDMYLLQVKKPGEPKSERDLYNVLKHCRGTPSRDRSLKAIARWLRSRRRFFQTLTV